MKPLIERLSQSKMLLGAIVLSGAASLLHFGPLAGTGAALVLTVALQFYLSGYLLARALGKHRVSHPVMGFVWILVCAFSLNVCLGGAARLFRVPIPAYVALLHGVMLVLALLPAPPRDDDQPVWRFSWAQFPLYLLLLLCCGVVLAVSIERNQYRFNGYEDQTVFIELADWLAHDPDDPGRRSRRIGVEVGDTRWDTDGWTFNHAAWVWSSGVPAAQLFWVDLTPLFSWTIPLVIFGLAYELTQREEAAALSAAALTLFGLMTLDSLVYYPTTLAFGQFSLFQVNTLRTISTALMTPLALLPVFAYLRHPSNRLLVLVFLAGLALATMHPRQIVILLYSGGAPAFLWWLAQPSRVRAMRAALLCLTLASLMALPLIQRSTRPFLDRDANIAVNAAIQQADDPESEPSAPTSSSRAELQVIQVPILGATTIVEPGFVFYHPVIVLAAILGLLAVFGWRRSLAAQYIFGVTAMTLVLLFVPGIAGFMIRMITPTLAPGILFGLPVALTLGLSADLLISALGRLTRQRWLWQTVTVIFAAGVMLALLFEPFPIPASARDQIRASNAMQQTRDIHPADLELLAALNSLLPTDRRSVLITPLRVSNYVVESVPRTLITGGRGSGNVTFRATRRFLSDDEESRPFLDIIDLEFIRQWNITHVILEADDTRLAQMLLQPEWFERVASPAGYVVFRVVESTRSTPEDELFAQMNTLYHDQQLSRWGTKGFQMAAVGGVVGWQDVAAAWAARPESDRQRLGLAFTYLMMSQDEQALPLWQRLYADYPDVPFFSEAIAYTQDALGQPRDGADVLLAALGSQDAGVRVLAARTVLAENFYYLLDDTELQRVIDVTDADAVTWDQLANVDHEDAIRQRVVLLMSRGQWATAARWAARVVGPEVDPRDLVTRASIALVQGDVTGATALLQPALDPDMVAANRHQHPDRWQDNIAAQAYYLLQGEITQRDGRTADAEAAFQQAIAYGADWTGRVFLAQLESDEMTLAAMDAEWQTVHDTPMPQFVSLLHIADTGTLYVNDPQIDVDDEAHTLTVTTTFGSPHILPYPVREWRVQVASPDAAIFYGEVIAPAINVPGALLRVPMAVDLVDDLPPLTPALVFIEPRYDNRVTFGQSIANVILNRPGSATPSTDAVPVGLRFGEAIMLDSYEATVTDDALSLTLYWQADAPPQEDYQIFVHLVGADGTTAAHGDSGPVDNRYPASQWRTDTLIDDTHVIPFDAPLPDGDYQVVVGMYRLPDGTRLPVTPADERVHDDSVTLYHFTIP
jgi:hypothetical protein